MSGQLLSAAAPFRNSNISHVVRHTANYPQIKWEDHFINYITPDQETHSQRVGEIEELKEEVRRKLLGFTTKPDIVPEQLTYIDAVQRLGVGYHFQNEIGQALQQVFASTYIDHELEHDIHSQHHNLYIVALRFRLLRQNGMNVSTEVFNKFKDDNGKFKESLIDDARGLLALYDAAHFGIHGEDILDEALDFTRTHLESMVNHLSNNPLAEQVSHTLNQSLLKGLLRLEAWHYISVYDQEHQSHDKTLLKLAKLDYNLIQSIHKKELRDIVRYWKDLDLTTKLPFARDRVVECFYWSVGVYFEPQYWLARKFLTIVVAITTYIDDVYDAYGTLEELKPFTEAILRWDKSCKDQLPEYMQICYEAPLNFFGEIEQELEKEGRSYRIDYAKEAMKTLVRGYLQEAEWFNANYIPTMEEHTKVSLVTCTYPMLVADSFVGLDDIITRDTFEWLLSDPKILRASSVITRLMDDIVGHQFEQERGHVASGIECYMKQYGVSEEEVVAVFNKQVVNAWKDINEELLKCNDVPKFLLLCIQNFARVMDVLYKVEDSFTLLRKPIVDGITSLFINPIPM
ncbi:Sesquiterpene synthase [Quillaja saponaria]|uniref:Sesquiterpene synthase n=1 Tax=Quillaja saponaria TaxID=32244 RepID=A0AAD7KZ81_QUISA|nr:Sesquiterpene synthase [Quillaja saponaria]